MTQRNRTALNMAFVSSASFLQILIQFLFFSVLAAFYGAGKETDALSAALVLPMVWAAVITGSISYVLVPELVSKFEADENSATAWQLASYVGLLALAPGCVMTLLLFWFAQPLCNWLYSDFELAQLAQTAKLLQILCMQVVLTGVISWAQAVHHSRHHFFLPALGGVLGTGLSLVLAAAFGKQGVSVIAWAINAGSAVSVLVHVLPLLPRLGFPKADGASLRRLLAVFWPLLVGSTFLRFDPVVDRVLASELDVGSVAHINYAQRIMMALLAVGTSSLSVIAFPQLVQRLSTEGHRGFAEHLSLAMRRLVLLVVPIVLGFSFFAVEIISDLLERGEFSSSDSRVVGFLVVALMGMFVGASAGELFARAFYVLGDTKTPAFVGVAALCVGLILKVLLFYAMGIWGIALGISGYFLLSTSVMALLLAKRMEQPVFTGCGRNLVHSIVSSLIACGCCYLVFVSKIGNTWAAAPMGALVYFAGLMSLRNADAQQLQQLLLSRLTRSGQ